MTIVHLAAKSKYGNKRTGQYASQHEYEVACGLEALEQAGFISQLRKQVRFALLPKSEGYPRPLEYVADFTYMEHGDMVVADAKGFRTPVYKLKRRLMKQLLGLEITEL